VWNWHP